MLRKESVPGNSIEPVKMWSLTCVQLSTGIRLTSTAEECMQWETAGDLRLDCLLRHIFFSFFIIFR